eukprot:tig00000459_g1138.t1
MGEATFQAVVETSRPLKAVVGRENFAYFNPIDIMDGFLASDHTSATAIRSRVHSEVGAFLADSQSLRYVHFRTALPLNLLLAHMAMRDATIVIAAVHAGCDGGASGPVDIDSTRALASAVYGYTVEIMDTFYTAFKRAMGSQSDESDLEAELKSIADPGDRIKCTGKTRTLLNNLENKCDANEPHRHVDFPPGGSCISQIDLRPKTVAPCNERLSLSSTIRPEFILAQRKFTRGLRCIYESMIQPGVVEDESVSPPVVIDLSPNAANMGGAFPVLFNLVAFALRNHDRGEGVRYGFRHVASMNLETRGTFTVSFTPHVIGQCDVIFVHALTWVDWRNGEVPNKKRPFWSEVIGHGLGAVLHVANQPTPFPVVWTRDQTEKLSGCHIDPLFNSMRFGGNAELLELYPIIEIPPQAFWLGAGPLPLGATVTMVIIGGPPQMRAPGARGEVVDERFVPGVEAQKANARASVRRTLACQINQERTRSGAANIQVMPTVLGFK